MTLNLLLQAISGASKRDYLHDEVLRLREEVSDLRIRDEMLGKFIAGCVNTTVDPGYWLEIAGRATHGNIEVEYVPGTDIIRARNNG